MVDSYSKNKKLIKKDFDKLKKIINQINQNTEGALHIKGKQQLFFLNLKLKMISLKLN